MLSPESRRRARASIRSAWVSGSESEAIREIIQVLELLIDDSQKEHQSQIDSLPIYEIGLETRVINCFLKYGDTTVGEARVWLTPGAHKGYPEQIAAYDMVGLGSVSIERAVADLHQFDLKTGYFG